MKAVFAQPRPLFVRTDVLRSGQAPKVWRRELFEQTHRLRTHLSSTAWVREIVAEHPALLKQPLFGSCLAEITASGSPTSEVVSDESLRFPANFRPRAPGSGNRRVTRPLSSATVQPSSARDASAARIDPAHTVAVTRDHDDQYQEQQSNSVSHLPSQVASALLRRLAGSPDVTLEAENSPDHFQSIPRRPANHASAVVASSLRQQQWRDLVTKRATRKWLGNWPSKAKRPTRTNPQLTASGDDSEEAANDTSLLRDHWVTAWNGQTASQQVLLRLVGEVGTETEPRSSTPQRTTVGPRGRKSLPVSSSLSGHENVAPTQAFNGDRRHVVEAENIAGAVSFRDQQLPVQQVFGEQPARVLHSPEFQPDDSLKIAPPALSQSLPPLLPTISQGGPVLPFAADIARRGAARDEAAAQEKDLSLLSAQIKRILDEEARRHGIDI
jgi:hypothetical protein